MQPAFSSFFEVSGFAHYFCIFQLLLIYRTEGGKTERMKLKKTQFKHAKKTSLSFNLKIIPLKTLLYKTELSLLLIAQAYWKDLRKWPPLKQRMYVENMSPSSIPHLNKCQVSLSPQLTIGKKMSKSNSFLTRCLFWNQ